MSKWTWGHIWTENDYREALCDSSCYNMFVEAVMERLSVLGIFQSSQSIADPGDPVFPVYFGFFYPFTTRSLIGVPEDPEIPEGIKYGRDWYKGEGNWNLRVGLEYGWQFLQRLVSRIQAFYVRTLDTTGSEIASFDGYKVIPSWASQISLPVKDRYFNDSVIVPKNPLPFPNWWTRKTYLEIATLTDIGLNGDVARLIPNGEVTSYSELEAAGMTGWYFERVNGEWVYNPNANTPTLIETKGLIEVGDAIGPWILNELRQAINELRWTFSTPYGGAQGLDDARHFKGYDKVKFDHQSGTLNELSQSEVSTTPNDPLAANRLQQFHVNGSSNYPFYYHQAYPLPLISPGIHPYGGSSDFPLYYVIFVGPGGTYFAPGDDTSVSGSWPLFSYPTFSGKWVPTISNFRSPEADPRKYTNCEGVPRQIDSYTFSIGTPLVRVSQSGVSNTWDFDFRTTGAIGVVKWSFKYSKNNPNQTWTGIENAKFSTNRPEPNVG